MAGMSPEELIMQMMGEQEQKQGRPIPNIGRREYGQMEAINDGYPVSQDDASRFINNTLLEQMGEGAISENSGGLRVRTRPDGREEIDTRPNDQLNRLLYPEMGNVGGQVLEQMGEQPSQQNFSPEQLMQMAHDKMGYDDGGDGYYAERTNTILDILGPQALAMSPEELITALGMIDQDGSGASAMDEAGPEMSIEALRSSGGGPSKLSDLIKQYQSGQRANEKMQDDMRYE